MRTGDESKAPFQKHSSSTLQSETVIRDCTGYRPSSWSAVTYWLLVLLSGGALWLLVKLFPHNSKFLLTSCPLPHAQYVLVKLMDGRQQFVKVHVYTISPVPEWLGLLHEVDPEHTRRLRLITLFLRRYVYAQSCNTFVPAPAMPLQLPRQICTALDDLHAISQGGDWKAFNECHVPIRHSLVRLYGSHRQLYSYTELVKTALRHAALPIFLIQYVECIYLLCRRRNVVLGFVMAVVSLAANAGLLSTVRHQHHVMKQLVNQRSIVPVVNFGWVRALASWRLVPGDVIVLQRGRVSCDMVLLRGSCLVEESMLSGEAAQVRKSGYVHDEGVEYHPDIYHSCTVFAGTIVRQSGRALSCQTIQPKVFHPHAGHEQVPHAGHEQVPPDVAAVPTVKHQYTASSVLMCCAYMACKMPGKDHKLRMHSSTDSTARRCNASVWNAEDPEEEVLAMVVRTGLNTTMGNMVRQTLSPAFAPAEKHPFIQDVLKLYAFALCLNLIILIPYAVKASHFHQSATDVLLRLADLLVHAAPPGLPAIMLFCGASGKFRLARKGINLVFPEVLKLSAQTTVACFDKTGTLTGSTADLHGVVPADKGELGSLQQSAVRWSTRLRQAAAVCHGLTRVHKTLVVGDVTEHRLFKLVEAQFLDKQTVVLPVSTERGSLGQTAKRLGKLRILKVFEFNSLTLMSGALVASEDSEPGTGLLFVKGAHTAIKALLQPASLPTDYDQVVDSYSKRSFRLMAMAVGSVPNVDQLDLPRLSQQHAQEQSSGFVLLGLIVLTNCIRPESKDTVAELQQRGGVRTMMITGDYQHTAIAVARDIGMVAPDASVMVIDVAKGAQGPVHPSVPVTLTQHSKTEQQQASVTQLSPYAQGNSCAHGDEEAQDQQQGHRHSQRQVRSQATGPSQSMSQHDSQGHNSEQCWRHSLDAARPLLRQPSCLACRSQPASGATSSNMQLAQSPLAVSLDHPEHGPRLRSTSKRVRFTSPDSNSPGQVLAHGLGSATLQPRVAPARLRFVVADGAEVWEEGRAVTALAEGQVQCAVTGDAFRLLLQLPDQVVLDAVMRNVVVFARMKPHQKGQIMSLLNARGLHQMCHGKQRHIQGLENTVLFCGDGINDLSALSAADVGYAVGATEASVAAAVHTTRGSVAGVCEILKEGKCSHAIATAMFKYMVGYQAIEAMAGSLAFYVDGSSFSSLQQGAIDFIAMTMGAAAAVDIAPLENLRPSRPDPAICTLPRLVIMASSYAWGFATQMAAMVMLCSQPWFTGGTGTSDNNPVVTACWTSAINQLMVTPLSLVRDAEPFCKSPLHNRVFLLVSVTFVILGTLGVLVGPAHKANIFQLYLFPQSFRVDQYALLTLAIVVYFVIMRVMKHIVRKRQQRQVAAA